MAARLFGSKYYEDPTIAQVSALEYDRVWGRIASKVARGTGFYQAREVVLAEEVPDMARVYGRTVAQRVSKAVQHTSPDRIPRAAKQAAKAGQVRYYEGWLMQTKGKVGWMDRICLTLFGVPF